MVDAQVGITGTSDLPQILQQIDTALDTLIQKVTQAGTAFQTFGSSGTGVQTALTSTATGVQKVDQALQAGTASITKYTSSGQALAQVNSQLTSTFTATTAKITSAGPPLQFLQQQLDNNVKSQQSFGASLKDNVLGLGLAASGITGIAGQFIALERSQLSLDKSQTKLLQSTITLSKARQKLTEMENDGKSSAEEIATQEDVVAKAYQAHEDAINTVSLKQSMFNDQMLSFGTTIVPNMIQATSGLISVLKEMGISMDLISAASIRLGSSTTIGLASLTELAGPLALAVTTAQALITVIPNIATIFQDISTGSVTANKDVTLLFQSIQKMADIPVLGTPIKAALMAFSGVFKTMHPEFAKQIDALFQGVIPSAEKGGTDVGTAAADAAVKAYNDTLEQQLKQAQADLKFNQDVFVKPVKDAVLQSQKYFDEFISQIDDVAAKGNKAFSKMLKGTFLDSSSKSTIKKAVMDFQQPLEEAFGKLSQSIQLMFTAEKLGFKFKPQDVKSIATDFIKVIQESMKDNAAFAPIGQTIIDQINQVFKKGGNAGQLLSNLVAIFNDPSIRGAMELIVPNFDAVLQKLISMAQTQGIKLGGELGGGIATGFSKMLGMTQSGVSAIEKSGGDPFGLLQSWFNMDTKGKGAKGTKGFIVPVTVDSAQAAAAVANVVANILPPPVTVPIYAVPTLVGGPVSPIKRGGGKSVGTGVKAGAVGGADTGGAAQVGGDFLNTLGVLPSYTVSVIAQPVASWLGGNVGGTTGNSNSNAGKGGQGHQTNVGKGVKVGSGTGAQGSGSIPGRGSSGSAFAAAIGVPPSITSQVVVVPPAVPWSTGGGGGGQSGGKGAGR